MRLYSALFLGLLSVNAMAGTNGNGRENLDKEAQFYKMPVAYVKNASELYQQMQLQQKGLEKDIFMKAYKGYLYLQGQGLVHNADMLSIADFSQSNQNRRLYIINLRTRSLMIHTYVSHGRKSGDEMAMSFSNVNNSNKSVLGFLLTADTYVGANGLSLRFRGMEKGINDLVTTRAIVVHGSKFVNEQELVRRGEMINSLGCPAVPMAQSKTIIEAIKGGSVYFIYHPDEMYANRSPILNTPLQTTLVPMLASQPIADSLTPPGSNAITRSN